MNDAVSLFAIFGAKYLLIVPVLLAGAYFLKVDRDVKRKIVIFSISTLPVILFVAMLASHVYENPRPFVAENFTPLIPHTPDNGFPSDHALLVSAIAAILSFFHRRLGVVLWLVAAVVSWSRVYVGVHHPIDVIGSMMISVFVTSVVYVVIKKKSPLFWDK